MINRLCSIAVYIFLVAPTTSLGATSAINNNVRILEDTIWTMTFLALIFLGLKMRSISGTKAIMGYTIFSVAGVCGLLWKAIGLAKRVFMIKEPVWFFDLTRETFEGLTGIVLAISFFILVYSLRRLFRA
ncbi:hypothetical protein ACFL17_05815 [Pseudomonadota bacterium]